MRDVLDELLAGWRAGRTIGLATLTRTWSSAPRQPGAAMLVDVDRAVGSVSGGCVEGAVYEIARQVLVDESCHLVRYGVSDGDALEVGLTCGGTLELFVQPISRRTFPQLGEVAELVTQGRPVAVATVVEHPDASMCGRRLVVLPDSDAEVTPFPGGDRGRAAITDDARGLLEQGTSELLTYGPHGERRGEGMRVFVEVFAPPPRLIVFGAIDFASAMADQGRLLGYHVTVCDARPTFATTARLPGADEVVVRWPHAYLRDEVTAGRIDARTVLAVLTHDPKFDIPLLQVALGLDVAYVGAMGSRRTHVERLEQLRAAGVDEEQLARLSSPIGLDLGARTPEETAVSIAAEIIALRWGGDGARLSERAGPIHHAHPGRSTSAPVARSPHSTSVAQRRAR